jgi:hypothetical protein
VFAVVVLALLGVCTLSLAAIARSQGVADNPQS